MVPFVGMSYSPLRRDYLKEKLLHHQHSVLNPSGYLVTGAGVVFIIIFIIIIRPSS